MVHRPNPRRQSRGFTLLLALGVVAVVTMAVMLSYSVVGREADTQADTRHQKQAFFAAEAGLAEGREAVRLLMDSLGEDNFVFQTYLGLPVTEPGLGSPTDPWYEVLPGPDADRWNYYRLRASTLQPVELTSGPASLPTPNQPYADYPDQEQVRYRVFLHNDKESSVAAGEDRNRKVWLVAVGEVVTANGRPTRSVVQALVVHANQESVFSPGCVTRGCGPDMTFRTPDKSPPKNSVQFSM
ncbi:hypothetical protein [Corallococcus aberystwythensis]|uniref:Type 4 fimbrial biogenesis protein PilX N-terminal domain-containing protein n=1 Tax=Corallococcus aberystwythensis TaxID=2316722 RepID=A0A3A8Q094_9BACT|nr:hypothetical protein [Corallococcus aberystwythensis]RKH59455.1 hypothetical protein D7W81_27235 [Corallococcus aberystwythensis]